jgi:2-polyprenyl-3-methyl-5-hydroxy-6-metoxy-1,4-benzoquinol methylase
MGNYPVHIDPLDANTPTPDKSNWSQLRRDAWASQEMEGFRESLRFRGLPDIRSAVIDDLSSYFKVDAEQCVYRARHSFQLSGDEWLAKDRSTEEGVTEFYLHLHSYVFGTLWAAYLEAEGYYYPFSVVIAKDLVSGADGLSRWKGALLDFGSGVGASGQLFSLLGYNVSLADISTPLLDFARFRFERRGLTANFINLNEAGIEENAYRVITAINSIVCVPDILKTARQLHAALLPGGTLYADINRSPRHKGASRLHTDDLAGRRAIRRSGFVAEKALDGACVRYRHVAPSGVQQALRNWRDDLVLGDARRLWRRFREAAGSVLQ